jgi:hypothetical protein
MFQTVQEQKQSPSFRAIKMTEQNLVLDDLVQNSALQRTMHGYKTSRNAQTSSPSLVAANRSVGSNSKTSTSILGRSDA